MNISDVLTALKLSNWTWRGDPEIQRPIPTEGQTQEEADAILINKIEWVGDPIVLVWADLQRGEQLVVAANQKASTYESYIQAGFDTGLGFKLAVNTDSWYKMSAMDSWLRGKNPQPLSSSLWTIKDQSGVKFDVTYEQFHSIVDAYGNYCYAAWKAF